jgi:hypothetical protein
MGVNGAALTRKIVVPAAGGVLPPPSAVPEPRQATIVDNRGLGCVIFANYFLQYGSTNNKK